MENKNQPDALTDQSSSQNQTFTSPPTNRLRTLLLIIFGLVVISISVFTGIQIGKNQVSDQQTIIVQPPIVSPKTDQITITGVIRTSGLSEDEKQRLGLSSVTYQLTDFNKNDEQDLYGYYLISRDKTIETLLGKCVQITGTEPTEWKNKNKSDSYLRTTLVVDEINLVDSSKCSPYSATPSANISGIEKSSLIGTVYNSDRPAPDINYDYQIKLLEPITDEYNASGLPQQITLVSAVPDTNDVWIGLTDNINLQVEIQGYMEWGYSESKFFRITSIKSVRD